MKPLREFGEIRHGNVLLVFCQGVPRNGEPHCCGMIRVPFEPTIAGTPLARPNESQQKYWHRESGTTVDDLTLTPSVDAGDCGHFSVEGGWIK